MKSLFFLHLENFPQKVLVLLLQCIQYNNNLPTVLQFVAVFYLSLVAILVGTNARRAEEDNEEDEDIGQKCQV
jgi:hypothetical protein